MEDLKVISSDLDYIMENYFNTDKEVMYICDYETALDILKYSEYEKEDFKDCFAVKLDCEYPYYTVYKSGNDCFIIDILTRVDGKLYPEYNADYILIQDEALVEYDNLLELCDEYKEIYLVSDCDELEDENEEDDEYTDEKVEELEDLIEEYTSLIQDTNGCPCCISEKLNDFLGEILDILYSDENIDEDTNSCDGDCENCHLHEED